MHLARTGSPALLRGFSTVSVLAAFGCGGGPGTPPPPASPSARGEAAQRAAAPAPMVDSVPMLYGVDLDTVEADVFDQGKMWTFAYPPLEYFREEYGFAPDSAWFRHARLAALRLPGCSASFVSPNGLVLTNHHCARESVSDVTREGEDLLTDGFYARSLEEERAVEDYHADQLIAIRDVSAEVDRRLANAPASSRTERREEIHEEIQDRLVEEYGGEDEGIVVEVISLYSGALTSAYVFKRYEDVRLVMAPELQIGFFGGDPDNFTYPRYNLDFSFFRVYDENGSPLQTDPYFRWSTNGIQAEDAVFVIGNPGSTSRLETFAQLMFGRDVSDKAILDFVSRRADIFQEYADANPEEAERRDLENTIFGLLNSEKAMQGQQAGLYDPVIMARLRSREQAFKDSLQADSTRQEEYGALFDRMAELQEEKREFAPGFGSFLALTSAEYEAATLHRALLAFQYLGALRQAAPIEMRNELRDEILAVPDKPAELDEALMQERFQSWVTAYGQDSEIVKSALQGRSPEGQAAHVRQNSVLADSAATARALESGSLSPQDPAIQVVQGYLPTLQRFQQGISRVEQQEANVAEQIGRARYQVYGTNVPPDATFSLRVADGVVQTYEYNGTLAPPYTTLYGLYDRYYSQRGLYDDPADSPWDLPQRWRNPPAGLELATPVNFIATSDIIGGNSGSPVINRDLQVVGLIFDGNMESLPGEYIYLPESNRAVAVDGRGILEALDDVYDMDRVVLELTTGRAAATEAEADQARR